MPAPRPSLVLFEGHVAAGRLDAACEEAIRLLYAIDGALGSLGSVALGEGFGGDSDDARYERFAARFAAAFGALMVRPDLAMSGWSIEALFIVHRWIDILLTLGGADTAALRSRLVSDSGGQRGVGGPALGPFLLLSGPSAGLDLDLDAAFAANPGLTLVAALGYLSHWCCLTVRAGALRERLLAWAPGKLEAIAFGSLRLAHLTDVYMTCSYASGVAKHRIKADLIAQARRAALAGGCREAGRAPPRPGRPRIVVVVERFSAGHSVYRTHSRAVRALRERFEVIGLAPSAAAVEGARDCFDAVEIYSGEGLIDRVRDASERILAHSPDIVLHLGVGLVSDSIALASLRLAPVQCASYGHGATTMSPVIDRMIAPDDYVGSEACFSEALLRLPAEAMPYARPSAADPPPPARAARVADAVVRIAVPASALKINAAFLQTLARISSRAARPVEFVFLPLGAIGLTHQSLRQEIGRVLPTATVHAEAPRRTYLERLGGCAFFLCPFPYGNMNGILDAVAVGLPGVCLDGAELHAHADVAIFRRLGLPAALAASDVDAYVEAAARLASDPAWLAACRDIAAAIDFERDVYAGDERLFGEALFGLLDR